MQRRQQERRLAPIAKTMKPSLSNLGIFKPRAKAVGS